MTPFQKHKKKWRNCERCDLYERRSKVVLCRGKLPCDILFVGEAPGISEDVLGRPFVGPAGKLLDRIIERAIGTDFRLAFTNLVGCIPKGEDGKKLTEPEPKCIKKCSSRLKELVLIAKPELVFCVGKLSAKHMFDTIVGSAAPTLVNIVHPAAILRADITQQGLMIQRVEVTIRQSVLEYLNYDT